MWLYLHVDISAEEVVKCVECLGLEALGEFSVEALLVGFPQERIDLWPSAEANEIKQVSCALTPLNWHLWIFCGNVSNLLVAARSAFLFEL